MQSSRAVVRIVQRDPFILIMGQNEIGHLFNILFRLMDNERKVIKNGNRVNAEIQRTCTETLQPSIVATDAITESQ